MSMCRRGPRLPRSGHRLRTAPSARSLGRTPSPRRREAAAKAMGATESRCHQPTARYRRAQSCRRPATRQRAEANSLWDRRPSRPRRGRAATIRERAWPRERWRRILRSLTGWGCSTRTERPGRLPPEEWARRSRARQVGSRCWPGGSPGRHRARRRKAPCRRRGGASVAGGAGSSWSVPLTEGAPRHCRGRRAGSAVPDNRAGARHRNGSDQTSSTSRNFFRARERWVLAVPGRQPTARAHSSSE